MIQQADSIIFDLDGTLWDSTATVAVAWQAAIDQLNFIERTITQAEVQSITGMAYDLIFLKLFPALTDQEREQLKKHCAREELTYMSKYGGRLYPELEATLRYLKEKYRLFIVSNCQSGYIEAFLQHHQLSSYFEDCACYGDAKKPKANNIRELMERNSLRSAVYVGDTQGDCDASEANHVPFIFASYGFGSANKYEERIEQFSDMQQLM